MFRRRRRVKKTFKQGKTSSSLQFFGSFTRWTAAGIMAAGTTAGAPAVISGLLMYGAGALLNGAGNKVQRVEEKAADKRRTKWAKEAFEQTLVAAAKNKAARFTLYLRPFALTGKLVYDPPAEHNTKMRHMSGMVDRIGKDLGAKPEPVDIERIIAESLDGRSYFVGLGKPGEHAGAGRIPVKDVDWQDAVRVLAHASERIVMLPYPTEGTLWEVQYILGNELVEKTVWVMPPETGSLDVAAFWKKCQIEFKRRHQQDLPEYRKSGALFTISRAGKLEKVWKFPAHSTSRSGKYIVKLVAGNRRPAVDAYHQRLAGDLAKRIGIAV